MSVIWCFYKKTRQHWVPYEPHICGYIENEKSKGASSVKLGQVDSKLTNYEVDLQTKQQVSLNGKGWPPCPVERKVTSDHPLANNYKWQFEGDKPGMFCIYDFETMQKLEDHFKKLAVLGDHLTLSPQYRIDFIKFIQIRQDTGKRRKIERRIFQTSYPKDKSSLNTGQQGAQSLAPANNLVTNNLPGSIGNIVQGISSFAINNISGSQAGTPTVKESLPNQKKFEITKQGKTKVTTESLILRHTEEVDRDDVDTTTDCPICMSPLTDESGFGEGNQDANIVIRFRRCKHQLHKLCLQEMIKNSHSKDVSIQCPSCKTVYGEKTGNCPPGTMEWRIDHDLHLAGYESYDAIVVKYNIPPGKQSAEHPNPKKPFNTRGFPRTGYIPNCDKGRKVLKLLIIAFQRRLMFTIGTSITTGESDSVVWNEIHLKTEARGNKHGHGYPDDNFLDNAILELSNHGVVEDLSAGGYHEPGLDW